MGWLVHRVWLREPCAQMAMRAPALPGSHAHVRLLRAKRHRDAAGAFARTGDVMQASNVPLTATY